MIHFTQYLICSIHLILYIAQMKEMKCIAVHTYRLISFESELGWNFILHPRFNMQVYV